jgi:hypothetical protein
MDVLDRAGTPSCACMQCSRVPQFVPRSLQVNMFSGTHGLSTLASGADARDLGRAPARGGPASAGRELMWWRDRALPPPDQFDAFLFDAFLMEGQRIQSAFARD